MAGKPNNKYSPEFKKEAVEKYLNGRVGRNDDRCTTIRPTITHLKMENGPLKHYDESDCSSIFLFIKNNR